MQGYYIVTETIKAQLELDPFVNTVNTGIIEDVLLKKADMYPYSHILVNNSSYQGNTWMFNLSVICMDIVDLSKDEVTEVFYGNDNQQDVLNTQLAVINRMLDILQRGQNTKSYILDGAPNCEPFIDRFEHGVAGWTVTFDIRIPNTMTVCSTDVTPVKLCPDFTYLIKDSADNTLYTGSILSGNGLTQTITDGEVTNSLGTVLGNVLAQGSLELSDVDNIDSDGSTVPTAAGVPFTCTPVAPCEDGTVNVNKSDGTLISAVTVASGDTEPYNVADSTAVLKDTDGNTLSTTSIKATESSNIEAPDSIVNINSVLWDNVLSGDTENISVRQSSGAIEVGSKQGQYWRIADSDITLNGGAFLSVKAEDSQDIELVDQDDTPIVPDSVVGNKITVDIPSGGSVGATLMKTGQTTSYRTGDDGDLEQGRATDFFNLGSNNPFGNLKRFTGTTGGYQSEIDSLFYDKDGIATTEALALPDDIVIDWSTNGIPSTEVLGYKRTGQTAGTWNTIIDNNTNITYGGFANWNVWNLKQYTNIVSIGNASTNQFSIPFTALNSEYYMWNSSTDAGNTSNSWLITKEAGQYYRTFAKIGTSQKALIVRTFTVTGTTLT